MTTNETTSAHTQLHLPVMTADLRLGEAKRWESYYRQREDQLADALRELKKLQDQLAYVTEQRDAAYAQQRQDAERYRLECERADLAELKAEAFRDALRQAHQCQWCSHCIDCDRRAGILDRDSAQWLEFLRARKEQP